MTPADHIRLVTSDDLDWVVEVTRQRRESLVPHAPLFWRPAVDATERHRAFMDHLIEEPEALSVRSQNGYLVALNRGAVWLVDDAVVTKDGNWSTDGVQLLQHAQEHCGALRFVVPVFETSRMDAGLSAGLAPVEHWWHRDLESVGQAADDADEDPSVIVEGAKGRLVPAPPVYSPGGPVLLVTEVDAMVSLRRIEAKAAMRGAPVSVVTQNPNDASLATLLSDAGYVLTTAFCEGR